MTEIIMVEDGSLLQILMERKHLSEQVQYLLQRGTELLDLYREKVSPQFVKVKAKLTSGSMPKHQTKGSAGIDIQASGDYTIRPHGRVKVGTGLRIAIPDGHVGKLFPRSGLAFNSGIVACDGTIDSDYRGEIHVLMMNFSEETFHVKWGMRIAQIVVLPYTRVELVEGELDITERGEGGLGSTGV